MVATEALLGNPMGRTMIELQDGRKRFEVKEPFETIVFPMFHPSYLLRNGNKKDELVINRFKRALEIVCE